jgi:hypothetical protein
VEIAPGLDKIALRDIEQRLVAELHASHEGLRLAGEYERAEASDRYFRALRRFTEFAAKGTVPGDLLRYVGVEQLVRSA